MQVSHELIKDEEDIPNNAKKSSYNLLVNNILIESINELNSVQRDLSDLQKQSALLEIKNQKIIENIKNILENFNNQHYLIDAYTQSRKIEFQDIAISCDIQPILPVIPEKTIVPNCNIQLTEIDTYEESHEKEVENDITESLDNTNKYPEQILSIPEERKPEIKPIEYEPLQTYSKADMLSYLAKYKIDFLKFLQCNRNNIEQFAGGYPELIRSFSSNSNNDDNSKQASKRKPTEKSTHSRQRYKTKSNSELKPGVIDTGDHLVDPSLKSSLYDDLDFSETPSDRAEIRHPDAGHVLHMAATSSGIPHSDLIKMGGEKRLNAIGVQSKMNLLKSRTGDSSSSKHSSHKQSSGTGSSASKKSSTIASSGGGSSVASQWKGEIAHLESKHEAHYPASASSSLPLVTEKQQSSTTTAMMKPLETVFTSRMRERLKRPVSVQGGPSPLPVVKYDLSTPDDPSFELDSKPIAATMTTSVTVSSGKSSSTAAAIPAHMSHHKSTITNMLPTTTAPVSSVPSITAAAANHSQDSDVRPTKHVSYSKSNMSSSSTSAEVLISPPTSSKSAVVASSSSNHHHNSRDKSKHKHKHSSKKRTKKPSKDLEDGEIV